MTLFLQGEATDLTGGEQKASCLKVCQVLQEGLPGASGHLPLIPKQQAFEGIWGSLKGRLL